MSAKAPAHRRPAALPVAAITLPVLVLGGGWLWASIRERETLAREERALLERTAEVVRATVDESLEELRAREDARPFYLYNHFYSPPDLVALNDPVAVSPLAKEPEDPRIAGYFQVDPGGAVRTPYEPHGRSTASERASRVLAEVSSAAFAEVRALALATGEAREQQQLRVEDTEGANVDVEYPALQSTTPDKLGQYTVSLNTWSNQLYEDIKSAQQKGEPLPPIGSTRRAPVIQRRNVTPRGGPESAVPLSTRGARRADPRRAAPRPISPAEPVSLSLPTAPTAVVDYTPMQLARVGERLVLYRTVTHEGVTSVQGVLLDEAHVRERWIPDLVQRHAVSEVIPTLVDRSDLAGCALALPASDVLGDLSLCFPRTLVEDALRDLDHRLYLQASLLLALVAIAAAAAALIQRAAKRAEELSRQKSAFVSAVSHELRTPLTTLRMHAEMLRDDLVDEERRPRFYTHMATEAVRLGHLVENVLEISRLDEGRRPLSRARADVCELVREVIGGQAAFAESRGFALEARLPDEGVELSFDRQALEQVLINLVDNAIKYAADADEKRIVVAVEPRDEHVTIHVLDRGPGIPANDRERVFERFYRVERPGKEHVVGTGLGLSLVRDLVRAHGGDVRIADREGGGADVALLLPRDPIERAIE